ncbi:MAG: hypothetical protein H7842_08885 [Gammaproteobacteria bacterium SHHR-1]|uniref:hypothetical protein n=1 Tax=Magnetovirga frankeli TaxID=947516 RepID=UPI001292EFDA|nr:hypothetical protein D5125_03370 [gamma proteobacterium SS-5]
MNKFTARHSYRIGTVLALLLCLLASDAQAVRPSSAMLDAMQAMVDSMSDYVESRRGSGIGLGELVDRRFGYGDEYDDLRLLYRDMPGAPARSAASRTQLLDGIWMGRNRSILMIRDGYLRVFAYSLAHSQDAEIYLDPPLLQIRNLDSGILHEFEFVYRGGKLAMRGEQGQILLYRRLNLDVMQRPKGRR